MRRGILLELSERPVRVRPRGDSERGQHVHRSTWIAVLALVAVVAIALIVGGWSWDSPSV